MKAIGRYIIVQVIEEEVKTSFGLLLSGEDTQTMRYKKARVITPGTDVVSIKEGDVVYYDKAQSFTMLIKDEQFTIIREGDVVVVE